MGILDSLFGRQDTPESLEGEVFSFFRKFENLLTRVQAVVDGEQERLAEEKTDHTAKVQKEEERHTKVLADEGKRHGDVVSEITANLSTLASAKTLAEKVVSFAETD